MKKSTWSGTGRRLFMAFSAFIALYAAASLFALVGIVQIHTGLERTRARVEGMRVALDLASAVRDQYAHLAHTIIIGNASHTKLYTEAGTRVMELARDMRRHAERPDENLWVSDIEAATRELDKLFHDGILPNVLEGQGDAVQAQHHQVLRLVASIQANTDSLATRFEESIAELQAAVVRLERRALVWSLVFLVVAPLVAGWVGIAIVRSVTRPIMRLQAGAERLASGDLDTKIDVDSEDEFGALAGQFNDMTISLKEHQDRLVHSEKLAGIGRLAAGVAHEINNPLGVILGYARVMKKKADADLAEDLGVIEEETLRCQEIVEGLLDLSRPLSPQTELVDLREVCDDVAARILDSQPSCEIILSVTGHGSTLGDPLKLRQVLFNLMKNGIEAAGCGGRVEANVVESGGRVEVLVLDSGKGLGLAIRERLFEPFFTTKPQGTGLGLAVSRAIVRAHNGEITFHETSNHETCFTVALPRAEPGDVA